MERNVREHRMTRHTCLILIFFVAAVFLTAAAIAAEELEFTFTNSFDGTGQQAVAYIPDACKERENNPLLVIAHYMGGNRFTGKRSGYYPECDARGYLLVCPELHGLRTGGQTSLSYLGAQHDVIDSIEYMKANYSVDTSRIYIVGRSMGGMLSQVMAAKYPDVFAAAVSGQGISDLPLWYRTSIPNLIKSTVRECGEYSEETRFDYERRSSVSFAPNLRYVPLILWHGTNDTWVPPEQSELIVKEARKYNRFQPDVHWLHGAAHCPANYSAKWICDQLTYYQNVCEEGHDTPTRFFPDLDIVTDEAKSFYWLGITQADEGKFARIQANLSGGLLFVRAENAKEITIDLDKISKQTRLSKYDLAADTDMRFKVVRGETTLFEMSAKNTKTGALPDNLYGR